MKRVRMGMGVAAVVLLMMGSFLVWGEVSAGAAQAERRGQSGCAALAGQRAGEQGKQKLVFEAEAGRLLEQGWQFQSYCCNPEFTDGDGQCAVFLVQG